MKSFINLLIKKKIKISVAESCTGGMLASKITSVSGASKVFNFGLVTYSNKAKIEILKIENIQITRSLFLISSPECYKSKAFNFFYNEIFQLKANMENSKIL